MTPMLELKHPIVTKATKKKIFLERELSGSKYRTFYSIISVLGEIDLLSLWLVKMNQKGLTFSLMGGHQTKEGLATTASTMSPGLSKIII